VKSPSAIPCEELMMDAMQRHFGPSWKFSEIAEWTLVRAQTDGISPWQVAWARDFLEKRRASQGDWEDLAS